MQYRNKIHELVENILLSINDGFMSVEDHDLYGLDHDITDIYDNLSELLPALGVYSWLYKDQDNVCTQSFTSAKEAEEAIQRDVTSTIAEHECGKENCSDNGIIVAVFDPEDGEDFIWERFYSVKE